MTNSHNGGRYGVSLHILSAIVFIAFLVTLWFVVRPFVTPLLWSAILATTTWPFFSLVRRTIPSPRYFAPLLVTLLLGAVLVVVLLPLPLKVASELKDLGVEIARLDLMRLRENLTSLPLVGRLVAWLWGTYFSDPGAVSALIQEHQSSIVTLATSAARGVLDTIVSAVASLIGCYLLFRYGDALRAQACSILVRLEGENIRKLIDTVHATVIGASYSILATALAQGVLAGIGYSVANAPTPLLLALATMILALIPFGSPLIYIPVSLYLLLFSGQPWWYGVGLAVWGIGVVSTIDNVLRSLFISQTTHLSAILVFIGVLGGVASFGLLGVFVGPAIVAVAQKLWLDLAKTEPSPT